MTDKYQDLREAISNAEFSDGAYWLDRYRGESGPETIRELLDERDRLERELKTERALSFRDQVAGLEDDRDALRSALADLLNSLSLSDEEGLMEYAEPVIDARAALAGYHPEQALDVAWRPIDEETPMNKDLLLAWLDHDGRWSYHAGWAGQESSPGRNWRHGRATHWMPLPAAPNYQSDSN